MAERAREWLARFAATRFETLSIRELALTLFGIALSGPPGDAGERIAETLAGRADDVRQEFAAGRFLTLLLAADAMPEATPLSSLLRESWLALDPASYSASPVIAWACGQLAGKDAPMPSLRLLLRFDPRARYVATPQFVRELAQEIAAASLFGRLVPPLTAEERRDVTTALRLWAFCYTKERDLDMLCPVVRAMHLLGLEGEPEYHDALEFIAGEQRSDGHFGMHEMGLAILEKGGDDIDRERELYLPLTVASTWTLTMCGAGDA